MDESAYWLLGGDLCAPHRLCRTLWSGARRWSRLQRSDVEAVADGGVASRRMVDLSQLVIPSIDSVNRRAHHFRLDMPDHHRRLWPNHGCALETNSPLASQ